MFSLYTVMSSIPNTLDTYFTYITLPCKMMCIVSKIIVEIRHDISMCFS